MLRRSHLPIVLTCCLALGCGAAAEPAQAPGSAPTAALRAPERPRVVLVVVLDQVGSWVLDRAFPALDEGGLLRTCAASGVYHHRVVLEHATTLTAPGHALIASGASPYQSGIDTNRTYDAKRGKAFSVMDDGKTQVFGSDTFASPHALVAETVSDVLRASTPTAKIVSVSVKDRSAILPAGQGADIALFFDKKAGRYTTSRSYADALPGWLEDFAQHHPMAAYMKPWLPSDPALLALRAGDDDGEGEGDLDGFGIHFPHDARATQDPFYLFSLSPGSTELQVDVARAALRALGVGQDDVSDMVWLSISATDHVGHTFGPESWESLDILRHADREVMRFVSELRALGPVDVVVSADHGVAPLVERSRAQGLPAARFTTEELLAKGNATLTPSLGPGKWVVQFAQPYLYLAEGARDPASVAKVAEAIATLPGVGGAYPVREAKTWINDADPLRRAVARGIAPGRQDEIYVFAEPFSAYDDAVPLGAGTSHGSPWPYDREVPVIACGPGVSHVETTQALSARRIATSIAALLGVRAPTLADPSALPGFPAPPPRE